jgi:hypothetical protein
LSHDQQPAPPEATPVSDISLASLLNVLWRRRWLVVLPPLLGLAVGILYGVFGTRRWEALATIRPGITAFSPEGGGFRQWQLKDITKFYENMLYRHDLVERLHLPPNARPVIKAEFVAQGLQNLQGGDVVTLSTTATSPALAMALLDTGISLFEEFAEADSVSSELRLTRDGLRIQMAQKRAQLTALESEGLNIALKIAAAVADSAKIETEAREIELNIAHNDAESARLKNQLAILREQEPRLASDLTDLTKALATVDGAGGESLPAGEVPGWVKRNAVLDRGDLLQTIVTGKIAVEKALWDNRALQQQSESDVLRLKYERQHLELERQTTISARRMAAMEQIGNLRLERQFQIPVRRQEIATEIREREVKLSTLAPLQRVGRTMVSNKPVRPRPLRATLILVFLGGIGGLALGLGWDYVDRNRREIFAR